MAARRAQRSLGVKLNADPMPSLAAQEYWTMNVKLKLTLDGRRPTHRARPRFFESIRFARGAGAARAKRVDTVGYQPEPILQDSHTM